MKKKKQHIDKAHLWARIRLIAGIILALFVPVSFIFRILLAALVVLVWCVFDNHKVLYEKADQIHVFFGVPGSGKTSMAAKLCKAYEKDYPVLANTEIKGAKRIVTEDLGVFDTSFNGQGAVILLDEASINGMDNRDHKSFTKEEKLFFALHRHMSDKVFVFSQGYDVDKKIRDRAGDGCLYQLIRTGIPGFVVYRRIRRRLIIDEQHQLNDGFKFIGLPKILWVKDVYKRFDSKETKMCPKKQRVWNDW